MAALSTGWVEEISIVMATPTTTMNTFLADSLKNLEASHARAMATTLTRTTVKKTHVPVQFMLMVVDGSIRVDSVCIQQDMFDIPSAPFCTSRITKRIHMCIYNYPCQGGYDTPRISSIL